MLWQRLQRDMPTTLAETIKIADSYALGDPTQPSFMPAEPRKEKQVAESSGGFRRNDRPDFRNKRRDDRTDFRNSTHQVAAVDQDQPEAKKQWRSQGDGKKPWGDQKKAWPDKPKFSYEAMLDQPCRFHTLNPSKPANHTTRHCSWLRRASKGEHHLPPPPPLTGVNLQAVNVQPRYTDNRGRQEEVHQVGNRNNNHNAGQSSRNEFKEPHQSYVVFVTEPTDKRSQHRRNMEVNAVTPAIPKLMYWSHQEITWSQKDHPSVMPNPGGYALVLDPIFIGPDLNVKFSRVLIDDGSSINILYRDTMVKLGITENMLEPSRTTFHGIVPGVSCAPMGKIRVDVLFGTKENCRTENILFEVVDLESPYHALLGRPALAQFMAATHIGYLKMKVPGPNGIITIAGSYKRSMECASVGSALAESLVIAEEKRRIHEVVAMAQSAQLGMPGMTNPHGSIAFQPIKETKSVPIDDEFPDRTVIIGAGLADK